ncbi:hypothetical protein Q7P37_001552 [Cladosporium fusiforme]
MSFQRSPHARINLGTVLVTGGSGGLASQILRQLLEHEGTAVHSIDIRHPADRISGVTYHLGDLTDYESLRVIFENVKPEVVVHTASPRFDSPKHIMFAVNVRGTETLVRVAKESGTRSFIYTSSASVISDGRTNLEAADETYPLVLGEKQPEYYVHTKALAEQFVLSQNRLAESPSFLTCAIRPSGIVGSGDLVVLPGVLEAYYNGRTKFQIGSNRNLFDFTCNTNVAYAHCLAAAKLEEQLNALSLTASHETVDGEAFIVTNDEPRFFWDFTRRIWQLAGDKTRPDEITKLPRFPAMVIAMLLEWMFWALRLGEPPLSRTKVRLSCMTRYFCIDKAKTRLGYSPLVSLDDALEIGVKDCLERRDLEKALLVSAETKVKAS